MMEARTPFRFEESLATGMDGASNSKMSIRKRCAIGLSTIMASVLAVCIGFLVLRPTTQNSMSPSDMASHGRDLDKTVAKFMSAGPVPRESVGAAAQPTRPLANVAVRGKNMATRPSTDIHLASVEEDEQATKRISRREIIALASALSFGRADKAMAAESSSISEQYDGFAETYDTLDGNDLAVKLTGIDALRKEMFGRVKGDNVLELGIGTGLNLPYYSKEGGKVNRLTGVDISGGMLAKAKEKFATLRKENRDGFAIESATFLIADVEQLPFEDDTFDMVLDTFSLCVFEKPDVALREARRVLKKGGKLLLLEHTRAKNGLFSAYQSATSGMVKKMGKGCDWSQDVEKLVREAGFEDTSWGPKTTAAGLLMALEVRK